MFKKNIIKLLGLLLLFNCGFQVSYENINKDFKILNIVENGDKTVNFKIKNNLIFNNPSKKLINIELNTNRKNTIKEKNVKNEITKQEVVINVSVNYSVVGKNKSGQFTVVKKGIYEVNERNFRTKENEKKLVNNLVKEIADEILENIGADLDDI